MPSTKQRYVLLDAGVFIGALLSGDPRHQEALAIVESARRGELAGCTTTGILSEVYAALTWHQALPPHDPKQAAEAVLLLIEPPSMIELLADGPEQAANMLSLAADHGLRARRVHDARHAAAALVSEVAAVFTYDVDDWEVFEPDGLRVAGPPSTLARMGR
jgi:predicted nucleic acid-binding protein